MSELPSSTEYFQLVREFVAFIGYMWYNYINKIINPINGKQLAVRNLADFLH